MDELQKQETRNKQNKDVYERLKGDLRVLKEQEQAMQRALEPKVIARYVVIRIFCCLISPTDIARCFIGYSFFTLRIISTLIL